MKVTNPNGSYTNTYDNLGNIIAVTDSNGNTVNYTYDYLGQLTSEIGNGLNYTVTYDNRGNILTKGNNTYTYGNSEWQDLLTAYNGTAITYDAIGNPNNWRDGMTFTWQKGRQLASVTKLGSTYSYAYDSSSIRTSKTVNGVTTNYTYVDGKLVHQTDGTTAIWFYYDATGKLIAMEYNGEQYYYMYDSAGNIVSLVSNNAVTVATYTYDAWGKLISSSGTMAEINPIRYKQYYYDTETGFYYLMSRYYDPEVGRFINADAYASTGQGITGCNMFLYCTNNPVSLYDPDGQDAIILYDSDNVSHIGLLVQGSDGTWYHYYWGAKSGFPRVLCVFSINVEATTWCKEYTGEINLVSINNSHQFSGDYEELLYLYGDFSSCIDELKNSSEKYNLYSNNCSQKSLSTLSTANTQYQKYLKEASKYVLPRDAFNNIIKNVHNNITLPSEELCFFKNRINMRVRKNEKILNDYLKVYG